MFTGLIEEQGKLHDIKSGEIAIKCDKILDGLNIGDSVSINGVCLSVISINDDIVRFHVSPTTMNLSNFRVGSIFKGEYINLERAMRLSDRFDGHIVQGHIDGIAEIIMIQKIKDDHIFEFLYPKKLKHTIVPKGSIAIDGISLTINELKSSSFMVNIIPQTFKETNLQYKKVGDKVHIETDLFAKTIYHIIQSGGFYAKYE